MKFRCSFSIFVTIVFFLAFPAKSNPKVWHINFESLKIESDRLLAQSDTVETKKERVKKTKKKWKGPTEQAKEPEKESEKDEGFFESCLIDCLSSMLESVCSGLFSGSEGDEAQLVVEENNLEAAHADTVGWVQETELTRGTKPSRVPAVEAKTDMRPYRVAAEPKWQVTGNLFLPVFARKAISEEYKNSGWGIGAGARLFFIRSMFLDFSFGYTHANGEPQYDYVIGTIRESPSQSDLDIWNLSLGFGQLYSMIDGSVYFAWGIGPSIFKIKESADLTIFENGLETGTRTEELSKWKAGGELEFDLGTVVSGGISLSLHTRFSAFSWDSEEEKSLTLDFLGKNSIGVYYFGFSFGYLFY